MVLLLVVPKIAGITQLLKRANTNIAFLKKQAAASNDEYLRLTEELEKSKNSSSEAQEDVKSEKVGDGSDETDITTFAEVQALRRSLSLTEKELDSIRNQAKSQAEEYMRLLDENKALKGQLEDFDMVLVGHKKKGE